MKNAGVFSSISAELHKFNCLKITTFFIKKKKDYNFKLKMKSAGGLSSISIELDEFQERRDHGGGDRVAI